VAQGVGPEFKAPALQKGNQIGHDVYSGVCHHLGPGIYIAGKIVMSAFMMTCQLILDHNPECSGNKAFSPAFYQAGRTGRGYCSTLLVHKRMLSPLRKFTFVQEDEFIHCYI
jgi:hypothetical protein